MSPPTRKLTENELKLRNAPQKQFATMEKDETELRLEKMLFGDEAGFMGSLAATSNRRSEGFSKEIQDGGSDTSAEEEDENMQDVPDEELFFLDAGIGNLPVNTIQELVKQDEEAQQHRQPPIWIDSDDERITVSLSSNTRLRKLRDTEEDDVVTGMEYVRRLRRQYERLHPTPEWVKYARKKRRLSKHEVESTLDSDSDISVDDPLSISSIQPLPELLRSSDNLIRTYSKRMDDAGQRRLRPGVVNIQRLKDIAASGPSSIDTMQFHPHFPLLLTGGPSSTINLYHVSPEPPNPNPLVTSLHLKNTPLHTAEFSCPRSNHNTESEQCGDDTSVFVSSRRRYFNTWSLASGTVQKISRPIYGSGTHEQRTMENFKLSPCGRYMGLISSGKKGGGTINVLSIKTMQWTCACRIDSRGGIADFSWWRNGNGFAVVGKNGEVSEYSVEQKKVIFRWLDEGAVGTTTMALGGEIENNGLGGSRWAAIGSSSGIVNVYDRRGWTNRSDVGLNTPQRPKPARAFDQLTTPTSHLEFSDDGQMMVMSSRWKKNALRLVHLPTCTVYRNWPTDRTPLGRVSSIALSMDGTYLAVANEQGKVKLFQIRD